MLGTRKKHVQAPRSLSLIDRSETLKEISVLVATIGHRYYDHVPFIALNILQILDEERLRTGFVPFDEEPRDLVIS